MKFESVMNFLNSKLMRWGRSIVLPFLLIIITVSCDAQDNKSFSFVFMTDIHVQDDSVGGDGFKQAIDKINELSPDFVLTGGDMIMDALGKNYNEASRQFDYYQSVEKNLKMPVYRTIGNHENFGLYPASGVSPDDPGYGKKMYEERLGDGRTYYSFDHKNWHFIVLDDIGYTPNRRYYGNVDSVQIEWLKNDLKNVDKKTPITISAHIPLVSVIYQISDGGTSAAPSSLAVWNSDQVLKLFQNYNLRLVLQGHLHMVEEMVVGNIHFITGGAVSGDKWTGPKYIFPEGFVVIDIDGDNFDWHYQTYGWKAHVKK